MRNLPYGTSYPCLMTMFYYKNFLSLTLQKQELYSITKISSRAVTHAAEAGAQVPSERGGGEEVTVS